MLSGRDWFDICFGPEVVSSTARACPANRRMTPWKQLNTFCVAARHESFKLAADELCLSPSAISHQLRDLENHLGVELFERQTRRIVLNLTGRNLLQQLEPHFGAIDQAVKNLRAEPDAHTVHIKVPEYFARELFIPRVAEFSAQNRNIDLRIETTRSGMVSANTADLAILLSGKTPQFAQALPLFPIRYVPACASHSPLLEGESTRDLLQRSTLLVHQARSDSWQKWADAAGLGELKPPRLMRFDSMLTLVQATEQGLGIGLLPMPLSAAAFASGRVRRLCNSEYVTSDFYYVVASRGANLASQKLMQWIAQTFDQLE